MGSLLVLDYTPMPIRRETLTAARGGGIPVCMSMCSWRTRCPRCFHAPQRSENDRGLDSDFDGVDSTPRGMEDVSKLPDLVRELAHRGYSEEDLEKILGGNVLRVMRQVEQFAQQMKTAH